jgi:hypothetical protein
MKQRLGIKTRQQVQPGILDKFPSKLFSNPALPEHCEWFPYRETHSRKAHQGKALWSRKASQSLTKLLAKLRRILSPQSLCGIAPLSAPIPKLL